MAKENFYIKIMADFLWSDKVKYLMGISPLYPLLYQNIALLLRNTNGRFEKQIGSLKVPFGAKEIYQETLSFFAHNLDEFTVAFVEKGLKLFLQMNIINKDKDGILYFNNFEKLVGSISNESIRKSAWRKEKKLAENVPQENGTMSGTMSQDETGQCLGQKDTIVYSLKSKVLKSKVNSKNNNKTLLNLAVSDKGDMVQKSSLLEERFNRFWKIYPRKKGKGKAFERFKKLNPNDELTNKIIEAVKATLKDDPQWKKDDGAFIPYPQVYLGQKRWEDDNTIDTSANAQSMSESEMAELTKILEKM